MSAARRQRGFSLIELAVVLVIIGLLIGGGIAALNATAEQSRRSEDRRQLQLVRDALIGHAMATGRLPCADTDGDGREEYTGSACSAGAERGRLPWVTLGLGRSDASGYPLFYSVTPDYADAPVTADGSSFDFSDTATLAVYDDAPTGTADIIAEDIPAVVVTFGPQGGQVWTGGGFTCPGSGAGFSQAETENCGGGSNDNFVDAGYRTSSAPGGRFDDLLVWVPDVLLKARMVDAGRLP